MEDLSKYLSPAKAPSDVDPLDELLNKRARDLRAEVIRMSPPPDAAARANDLSRAYGVTPTQADSHLQTLEQQSQLDRLNRVMDSHPAISAWAEQNPRSLATAADDSKALGLLGQAFVNRAALDKLDIVQNGGFFDRMGDLFKSGLYSLEQGAASFRGALQDWSARHPLPCRVSPATHPAHSGCGHVGGESRGHRQ